MLLAARTLADYRCWVAALPLPRRTAEKFALPPTAAKKSRDSVYSPPVETLRGCGEQLISQRMPLFDDGDGDPAVDEPSA
jgi:hypothetical protein